MYRGKHVRALFLSFIPLFFVIQTIVGRKNLGNIHSFMYTNNNERNIKNAHFI